MKIAEVKTTYRAVYWLEGKELEVNEVYLTRYDNSKFVTQNSEHSVLCASVNLSIRKGKVTGEITNPTQSGMRVYSWYLYNVETNAKF
ncbi:hypothetical protein NVP1179O_41 [Vibrio phage 1.179.O._10N.286.45.F12]|nr:hypothetical protein NVP1179O_41 [Vibrio phage 1.179.O._10N.286.45.F12]